jgi:hypothetical protein
MKWQIYSACIASTEERNLKAISCQFVAEHATSAPQLGEAAWDKEEVNLQTMKRLTAVNLARAAILETRGSTNQGSCAMNL